MIKFKDLDKKYREMAVDYFLEMLEEHIEIGFLEFSGRRSDFIDLSYILAENATYDTSNNGFKIIH